MEDKILEVKNKFLQIKSAGWHKSIRSGPTGVGATFEHLLNLSENNLEIPDLIDVEIKTHRNYSNSYITLFNCTPEGPHFHEVERLKDLYGYPDSILKNHKVLNNTVIASRSTIIANRYLFKLNVDREQNKVFLKIFDIHGNFLEGDVYWSFDILKEKLYRKLKCVAFVYANRKMIEGIEYFNYYKLAIYLLKSFDDFITLIENGKIRFTFSVGVFRSGARIGQIHDHGTGISIHKDDLSLLFNDYILK